MPNQSEINRRSFLQLVPFIGTGALLVSGCGSLSTPIHESVPSAADLKVNFPLRLHSNENPYGAFPQALPAIQDIAAQSHRYTSDVRMSLKKALAEHYRLDPGQILLGCGSIELLKIITDVFCSPSLPPVIAEPIYEAIGYYTSLRDIHPVKVPLTQDFKHDLSRMDEACRKRKSLVYICNPANPTGTTLHKDAVRKFLDSAPEYAIIVVDEAYAEYADRQDYESCVRYVNQGRPNVIVLRTFSKIYGLAGLRVGYAMGPTRLIRQMSSHRLWNNINQTGAAAALASFGDQHMISIVRRKNARVRQYFCEEMKKLNMEFIPSEASFVMFNAKRSSLEMISAFKEYQIFIGRPIPSLPQHVRISLGTREEMKIFFNVLKKIV